MKKGIKYAGIAAAVLLTVAPVATPVVGLTTVQTSQATVAKSTTEADQVDAFFSQFASKKITAAQMVAIKKNTIDQTYNNFIDTNKADNKAFYDLRKFNVTSGIEMGTDAKISATVVDGNGNAYSDTDVHTLIGDVEANTPKSINVKFTVKYTDKDNNKKEKAETYTFTKDDNAKESTEIKQINAKFTNPVHVAVDSKTIDYKLTPSANITLTDQNGKEIKTVNPKLGAIYTTFADAKAETAGENNHEFKDAKFTEKGKTYYQKLTVDVKHGDLGVKSDNSKVTTETISNGYIAGTDGFAITINGKSALKSQYDVVAGSDEVTGETPVAEKNNSISFVRAITVGEDDKPSKDEWKTEDVNGVITVGDKTATLFDAKLGKATRGLAAGTGWITTMKRTNAKTGEVQYRVSTDEWMNEKDGKYVAKDTNTDNGATEGKLINVKKYNETHIVSLQNKNYVYSLYTHDLELSKRGLAGDSAWQCDRTAQDSEGTTYYRVSTNEWVAAGEGVSFK